MNNYRQDKRARKGIVNICYFDLILEIASKDINYEQKFKKIKAHIFECQNFK